MTKIGCHNDNTCNGIYSMAFFHQHAHVHVMCHPISRIVTYLSAHSTVVDDGHNYFMYILAMNPNPVIFVHV
jgi:hypothetical protein